MKKIKSLLVFVTSLFCLSSCDLVDQIYEEMQKGIEEAKEETDDSSNESSNQEGNESTNEENNESSNRESSDNQGGSGDSGNTASYPYNPYKDLLENFELSLSENQYWNGVKSVDALYINISEIESQFNSNNNSFYNFNTNNLSKKIPNPGTQITSKDVLSDIMDYCAFYHIPSITLSYSDEVVEEKDLGTFVLDAYWDATLMSGCVNYSLSVNSNSSLTITFNYSEDANKYYLGNLNENDYRVTTPYDIAITRNTLSTFPYELTNKIEVEVYNSDQLVYAFQQGYKPIAISGSPAELVLNKAKEINISRINDSMSENEKLTSLMLYLIGNCTYDFLADGYLGYLKDINNHPDELASKFCSMYAEGPLFYNTGVCHGFAKAMAILMGVENIDFEKVTSADESTDKTKTQSALAFYYDSMGIEYSSAYYSHGYLYTLDEETNLYSIIDPTYSYGGTLGILGCEFIRGYAIKMSYNLWSQTYSMMQKDRIAKTNQLATTSLSVGQLTKLPNSDNVYLYATTHQQLLNIIDSITFYVNSYNGTINTGYLYFHIDIAESGLKDVCDNRSITYYYSGPNYTYASTNQSITRINGVQLYYINPAFN